MSWRDDANCRGLGHQRFFPAGSDEPDSPYRSAAAARRVCARCKVREECLEYALAHRLEQGVWGGATTGERERIRCGDYFGEGRKMLRTRLDRLA